MQRELFQIDEDRIALHAGHQRADLVREAGRLAAVQSCDLERLVGAQRKRRQIEGVEAMHLVHHPQLHYRVLVVVDCLVVEPHGDIAASHVRT